MPFWFRKSSNETKVADPVVAARKALKSFYEATTEETAFRILERTQQILLTDEGVAIVSNLIEFYKVDGLPYSKLLAERCVELFQSARAQGLLPAWSAFLEMHIPQRDAEYAILRAKKNEVYVALTSYQSVLLSLEFVRFDTALLEELVKISHEDTFASSTFAVLGMIPIMQARRNLVADARRIGVTAAWSEHSSYFLKREESALQGVYMRSHSHFVPGFSFWLTRWP